MKRTLALIALLGAAMSAPAQVTYVPDNVTCSGVGQTIPFGFPSVISPSLRYQQIFPAANLPNQPVRITGLGVSRGLGTGAFQAQQFQLRMSHTTVGNAPSSLFASNLSACPVVLQDTPSGGFSYDVPAQSWADIPMACEFGYDGQRDLTLEVRYRGKLATSLGIPACSANLPRVVAFGPGDQYAATSGNAFPVGGLKYRVTYSTQNVLLAPDTIKIGTTGSIDLHGAGAGARYAMAASFGQTPLNVGNYRVCLALDDLLRLSILGTRGLFTNYAGAADNAGRATGTISVPAVQALAGVCIYHAAITFGATAGATNTTGTMLIL